MSLVRLGTGAGSLRGCFFRGFGFFGIVFSTYFGLFLGGWFAWKMLCEPDEDLGKFGVDMVFEETTYNL